MEETNTGGARYPVARRDDLVVEALADETLVYDLRNHKAHCLNAGAALVWQHCDGEFDEQRLTTLLHDRLGTPNDVAVVEVALKELAAAKLLEPSARPAKISRRDVARRLRLVVGASVALPAVMSIVAPNAASAASLVFNCAILTNKDACNAGIICRYHSKGTGNDRCHWIANSKCVCEG